MNKERRQKFNVELEKMFNAFAVVAVYPQHNRYIMEFIEAKDRAQELLAGETKEE